MKSFKFGFILVFTLTVVLTVFFMIDAVIVGIISLLIAIWNEVLAMSVFKWSMIATFGVQTLIIIPFAFTSIKEGDDKGGT